MYPKVWQMVGIGLVQFPSAPIKVTWRANGVLLWVCCDEAKWMNSVKFKFLINLHTSFEKVPFTPDPIALISYFQSYEQLKGYKSRGNKGIICFVWIYVRISICKFWLILLDHIKSIWKAWSKGRVLFSQNWQLFHRLAFQPLKIWYWYSCKVNQFLRGYNSVV